VTIVWQEVSGRLTASGQVVSVPRSVYRGNSSTVSCASVGDVIRHRVLTVVAFFQSHNSNKLACLCVIIVWCWEGSSTLWQSASSPVRWV